MSNLHCPCGTGLSFSKCCERYIRGRGFPDTAEALMRSRYTAYVIGNVPYLIQTRHPDFRLQTEAADITAWIKAVTSWDKLEVLMTEKGQPSDSLGFVAFNAFFHQQGHEEAMFEYSRFSKFQGHWVYEGPAA